MLFGWSAIALAGSTAMSFFSYVIRHDLAPTFRQLVEIYFLPPAGPAFWAMNFSTLVVALVAFGAIRTVRLRDQALWNAAQTELRGARLEAQLAEARLQALQAQINPHFLLNSLNAIASLVQIGERERASDAIGRLGDLLAIALRNGRDLNVTFGEELDFLHSYLKLCKLRFDANFRYSVSVPDSLRTRRVPALIVQPLIENSTPPWHGSTADAARRHTRLRARIPQSSSKSRMTAAASPPREPRRCPQVTGSQTSMKGCTCASAPPATFVSSHACPGVRWRASSSAAGTRRCRGTPGDSPPARRRYRAPPFFLVSTK